MDVRYKLDTKDESCNLVIDDVTQDLAGIYTCQDVGAKPDLIWGDAKLTVNESRFWLVLTLCSTPSKLALFVNLILRSKPS